MNVFIFFSEGQESILHRTLYPSSFQEILLPVLTILTLLRGSCIGLVISFAGVSPHSFSHHPDVPATNALGSSQTETSITVGIAALEAVLSLRHQKGCTTWAGSSRRSRSQRGRRRAAGARLIYTNITSYFTSSSSFSSSSASPVVGPGFESSRPLVKPFHIPLGDVSRSVASARCSFVRAVGRNTLAPRGL